MTFDVGDSVPIAVDVKDSNGTLANASTAVLTVTLPDGSTTTPVVTNPPASAGQYRVTFVPTLTGRHEWRLVTTVPNTAYQDVFDVRESPSPSLISLADAKAHLNITTTASDDELREFLEAATEIVESYVGPVVTRTHTARVYGHYYRRSIALPHTQVTGITSITLVWDGSNPVNLADLTFDTPAGIVTFKSGFWFPYGDMDITYTVGRSYVKPNWSLAAKIIVKHLWDTQLGNLPSIQGDDHGYVVTGSGYLVPYRAEALLQADQISAGFA